MSFYLFCQYHAGTYHKLYTLLGLEAIVNKPVLLLYSVSKYTSSSESSLSQGAGISKYANVDGQFLCHLLSQQTGDVFIDSDSDTYQICFTQMDKQISNC